MSQSAILCLRKASLALASLHPSASPVWPPSGLALAFLLLWGNGMWPGIAAGAFLANATTFGSLFTSSLIAGGNTLEALITAALLQRWKASTHLFEDSSQVVLFACLTLLPGTMISATMGVGSLVLAGFADAAKFPGIWLTWWLGDVGGQLILTPFIVLWSKSSLREMGRAELQRLALLLGATIIVGLVAFSPLLQQTRRARSVRLCRDWAPAVGCAAAQSTGHSNRCARAVRIRDLGNLVGRRTVCAAEFERLVFAHDGVRDQHSRA